MATVQFSEVDLQIGPLVTAQIAYVDVQAGPIAAVQVDVSYVDLQVGAPLATATVQLAHVDVQVDGASSGPSGTSGLMYIKTGAWATVEPYRIASGMWI